ncbi:hypothetical protein PGT21_023752 [Puccinia graminis f. sp. tritici]|uniref:Uncharacterized protein n=1 Tax=Puccinia graminis f. sp. tritici TaxID=56615 RepID=A0A5B0M0Z6_PUCGR|nr:hypothetical protein PGT21_023752 [Puccinia graminis f. sp. tritici]
MCFPNWDPRWTGSALAYRRRVAEIDQAWTTVDVDSSPIGNRCSTATTTTQPSNHTSSGQQHKGHTTHTASASS